MNPSDNPGSPNNYGQVIVTFNTLSYFFRQEKIKATASETLFGPVWGMPLWSTFLKIKPWNILSNKAGYSTHEKIYFSMAGKKTPSFTIAEISESDSLIKIQFPMKLLSSLKKIRKHVCSKGTTLTPIEPAHFPQQLDQSSSVRQSRNKWYSF